MADQPYYSIFTKKGLELLTEAIRNGTKLGITHMAFGDGGGTLPVPNESFTKLVNEVHRTPLNSLAPDPNNASWLRAEAVIASATGGFNIRELGLYASDVLVAYSNYPATYKPNPSDGTARIMTFRMVLQIDNTASFELKIDADIVLATIASVNEVKQEVYENTATVIPKLSALTELITWQNRNVYVRGDGQYYYDANTDAWIKDQTLNVYDFNTQQYVEYYYKQLGNWSDAIELAQLNIYTKGYSEKLVFPATQVNITRPIYGGAALGLYLHQKHPELGIYNQVDNTFIKNPVLTIRGQGRNNTTINFDGITSQDDLTWGAYGVIHTAPLDVEQQCNGKASFFYHTNCWTKVDLKGFTLSAVNTKNGVSRPCLHGLILFRGNGSTVRDVVAEGLNGSGLLTDGFYDSWFENFTIFQCGRTSPVYNEDIVTGYTDIEYQTYAPLHIMRSEIGDKWDNCNFLRFNNFHIEDAHWAPADIIISGNSSPIWFDNAHLEADAASSTAKLGKKYLLALGLYGVSRLGQDTAPNYVFGSEKFKGNGGGYLYWSGGSCYSETYGNGIIQSSYTSLNIDGFAIPNNIPKLTINASNDSAEAYINNSSIGDIYNIANASRVTLTNSKIASYTQDYGVCPIMKNVYCTGAIKIGASITRIDVPLILDNVNCDYATGTVDYGDIDLIARSSSVGTTLFSINGISRIHDNYVLTNLGAI